MNRTAIVGVGAALLVIGLAGLGLEQSGVILPRASVRLPAVQSSGPPSAGALRSQGVINQAPKQLEPMPPHPAGAHASTGRNSPVQSAAVKKKVRIAHVANRAPGHHAGLKTPQRPVPRSPAVAVHTASSGLASRKPEFNRERRQAVLKTGLRRYAGRRAAPPPMRPVMIRFTFDPARDRPFNVASVHLGDRIKVDVRQVGQVNRRVYFTFSRGLNSRRGAVLKLRTMYSFERPVYFRGGPGYYVIQVRIYPDNRWRILPRSLV